MSRGRDDPLSRGDARGKLAERLSFLMLLVVVVWMPLPLGSNRPWAWSLLEVAVVGGFGLALLMSSACRDATVQAVRSLRGASVLFAAWLAFGLFQTLPLGDALVAYLAPGPAAIYRSGGILTAGRPAAVAVDTGLAVDEWLKHLAWVVLFFWVLALVRSRRRLRVLALVLVGTGLFEAAYGLAVWLGGDSLGLWRPEWYGHHVVTGTFVNRNHFAAHIVMTFSVGLGLLLAELLRSRWIGAGYRQRVRDLAALLHGPRLLALSGLAIMALALVLSTSRGGMLALLGALALVSGLGAVWHRRGHAERRAFGVAMAVILAAVLWTGPATLLARFDSIGSESEGRIDVWRDTGALISSSPWFGVGGGNYRWSITAFRTADLGGTWINHAHNDYLELLAEYGAVGGLLAGLPVLMVLGGVLLGFRRRRDPLVRGLLFGALTACLAFLLHAFVDFNFRIPANAGYFFVILAMGLAAARVDAAGVGSAMEPGSSRDAASRGSNPQKAPRNR